MERRVCTDIGKFAVFKVDKVVFACKALKTLDESWSKVFDDIDVSLFYVRLGCCIVDEGVSKAP